MHKKHMPVKIFFCYAHEDETLLNQLKMHLRPLERQGLIELWYDRAINAGAEWEDEINQHLNAAQIILLLISPDFMNSEYCYGTELRRALERHKQGTARVIPLILRHVYWQGVLGQLQALPRDGLPITDPNWYNQDRALYNVTEGLRKIAANLAPALSVEEKPAGEPQQSISIMQKPASFPPDISPLPQSPAAPEQTVATASHSPLLKPFPIPNLLRQRWSRRTTLLAGVVLIGGGVTWFAVSEGKNVLARVLSQQAATPTPLTQGTTLLIYKGHNGKVFSAAWSPDGKRLASASQDRTVQVWNASIAADPPVLDKPLLKYTGHKDPVYSVAWSPPDGKQIASASNDMTVQIWNARTGIKPLFTYTKHYNAVWSVAWSPDGTRLASASEDKTVHIWSPSTGDKPIYTYSHSAAVYAVAWSPDGKRLASASNDGTAKVWDASTGNTTPLLMYRGHSGGVYSVAWSPDGTRLASSGQDKSVQIWDVSADDQPRVLDKPLLKYTDHYQPVRSVAWSHDGTLLASASDDGTAKVWDLSADDQTPFTYRHHLSGVESVAWSPTGKRLASASDDWTVQVWVG